MINISFTAENLNDLANQMSSVMSQIAPGADRVISASIDIPVSAPAPTAPAAVPVAVPAPAPAPVPAAAPVPAVPVSAPPAFTFEQIATAGASLIDSGKMDALLGLLGKFGVQSLTQLTPEQYGAVATELRALGAQI